MQAIERPILKTERLVLRPFDAKDAGEVQRMAGDPAVARVTLNIPHPYPDGAAETWIASHAELAREGKGVIYAIAQIQDDRLVGAIGSTISTEHRNAELGYWIGQEFWGRGYCTEAALELARFCFQSLGLHRIHAHHFSRNQGSGRVMQKVGMTYEGTLRGHVMKDGTPIDVVMYGLLRTEWDAREDAVTQAVQS